MRSQDLPVLLLSDQLYKEPYVPEVAPFKLITSRPVKTSVYVPGVNVDAATPDTPPEYMPKIVELEGLKTAS